MQEVAQAGAASLEGPLERCWIAEQDVGGRLFKSTGAQGNWYLAGLPSVLSIGIRAVLAVPLSGVADPR
jgi:hypothetical protein